jgi:DNA-binding MltR family transcriptional regulator
MPFFRTIGGLIRDNAIFEEIQRQEDRGAAIIAGSFLDEFLLKAISSVLIDDEKSVEEIFEGTAPLATFSAKIEMAYLMGLMSKRSRTLANAIRNVRNDFAHKLQPLTFDTSLIKGKCQTLLYQRDIMAMYESATKLFEKHGNMTGLLHSSFSHLIGSDDTPRNAYINTVMVHSVILQRDWFIDDKNKLIFPQKLIDEIEGT